MPKKTVTVPKAIVAHKDKEEEQLASFEMVGQTEKVETETNGVPGLVLELAHKVGEEPWTWFIAPTYVSIVMLSGKKYRFDREPQP